MAVTTRKFEGTILYVANAAGDGFLSSQAMTRVDGFGAPATLINITSAGSSIEESRMGIPDYGDVTIEMYYQPDDAFQQELDDMLDGIVSTREFKLLMPEGTKNQLRFDAWVANMPITMPYNDVVKTTITLTITNEYVIEAV